ncbi:hypothetical protein BLX88_03945 [Bacillus obstructivus]|nr:hypothetical protein BLX88_03945 [Bacillus obstructivus]
MEKGQGTGPPVPKLNKGTRRDKGPDPPSRNKGQRNRPPVPLIYGKITDNYVWWMEDMVWAGNDQLRSG